MTQLEIIAKMYELLSRCNRQNIEAAARSPGILPEFRRSLEYLAKTHELLSEASVKHPKRAPSPRKGLHLVYEPAVVAAVMNTQRFPSNEHLAAFLNKLGIGVSFNKKDGRKRMCGKLCRRLELVSVEKREKILRRLEASNSETAGWFDAIRGGHN